MEPFKSAEEAWFWFVRCQRARLEGMRIQDRPDNMMRPCDPDDIYRVALRLSRRGPLCLVHLQVLLDFGHLERPPDLRLDDDERAGRLWDEAMDRMSTILMAKGIVETPPPPGRETSAGRDARHDASDTPPFHSDPEFHARAHRGVGGHVDP